MEPESWSWKNLDVHLNLLSASDKQVRRNALNLIVAQAAALPTKFPTQKTKSNGDSDDSESEAENLQEDCGDGGLNVEDVHQVIKPLLHHVSDPVEKCRELSYEALTTLFKRLPRSSIVKFLPQIIPVLLERLGQQELIESSEEVRLIAVNMMDVMISRVGKGLGPFVDDWIRILSKTIVDPYHEVRKASCQVTSKSGKELTHVFHYNSERLIKPLCASITHQQSKVRVAVVKCIGDVLIYGNHKSIEEFILPLIQRLFDSQPKVRLAVVEVIGWWMLDYVDRYSFFHKMIPVIMTGLCDENEQVQELAYKLWEKVGEKFLEENIEEYKDQVDFPSDMPSHYPDDVKRPNFGCRLLTQRHVGKIIPGVTNDITDWVETTRQKCSQLLFHLILNCEENITMHTEQVLQCIFKSCMDPNLIVSSYVLKAAKLMGYFVQLRITWQILETRLSSNPNENALAVTASVIQGTNPNILKNHVEEITAIIATQDICHTFKARRQFWILQLCEAITRLAPNALKENEKSAENVFRILLSILAMSQDGDTKARAIAELMNLSRACELKKLDDLFAAYCGGIINEIKVSDILWANSTPEHLLLSAILTFGGSAVEKYLVEVLEVLVKELDPKKDTEVRLNLFTLLSEILSNYTSKETDKLQLFVKTIVEDILSPNLVWKAGKSASALRASATSCLLIILEEKLLSVDCYEEIAPQVVTGCLGLLEDNYDVNRLLGTQCLGRIVECCEKRLGSNVTHKIYPELMKRLDDEKNDIRVSAGVAISRVFSNTIPSYNVEVSKANLEFAANALLVHLDDEDENVQAAVAEALKSLGRISPEILIEKCESFKDKHRSPTNCEILIQHFQDFLISGEKPASEARLF